MELWNHVGFDCWNKWSIEYFSGTVIIALIILPAGNNIGKSTVKIPDN